jgi:hypothetical protein
MLYYSCCWIYPAACILLDTDESTVICMIFGKINKLNSICLPYDKTKWHGRAECLSNVWTVALCSSWLESGEPLRTVMRVCETVVQ